MFPSFNYFMFMRFEAGVKERLRYKDIEWLMPSIDLEDVFDKLGIVIDKISGDEIRALCPDHHLFVGRPSSDPNWYIDRNTGKTFCFTEARGSNLLWTVCRLLNLEPDDAARFLTGIDNDGALLDLEMKAILVRAKKLREVVTKEDIKIRGLDAIKKELESRHITERTYSYFIHPPDRNLPTNILRDTVDRYQVFERLWGYYEDRAFIPYFIKEELVGFCALELLGKDKWKEKHPALDIKDYRKVRYPSGFVSSECLFGFDDCTKDSEEIIITEGAREVMKLTQEGYQSVAILGAYMSDGHRRLLSELHPRSVILMFDGDDAGVAITSRVSKFLENLYSRDRIIKCFLRRGQDPKNLCKDEIREVIERGKSIAKR